MRWSKLPGIGFLKHKTANNYGNQFPNFLRGYVELCFTEMALLLKICDFLQYNGKVYTTWDVKLWTVGGRNVIFTVIWRKVACYFNFLSFIIDVK